MTRKQGKKLSPVERRIKALHTLLNSEKSTSNAKPFSEWEVQPEIIFENEVAKALFELEQNKNFN